MTTAPPSDVSPILTATGLEHRYGDVAVLDGLSLAVAEGELLAVVGPNGSGKSTLLKALAGIHRPTDGVVNYHDPTVPRPIGYLPQHPAFRPRQSARDTLAFYAALVGEPASAADAALERVGLRDAAGRDVGALSGGMRRLLAIAQATIGDPPVVVLDEPASGLDPEMRMHIFDTLDELAAGDTAVVVSSHDLTLVERTANRVVVLDGGEIVATGTPAAVCDAAEGDSLHAAFRELVIASRGTVRVAGVDHD